jgi:anti-sigma-K factor RskA
MSGTNGHHRGEDAAAYVLGALEPDEADAFRRHIADCPDCRDEVAAFERVTGALAQASARPEVPGDLRRRVMHEVRATPKAGSGSRASWTWPRIRFPLAWAGVLGVVIAAILVVGLNSSGSSSNRVVQANVTGVSGSAQLWITGDRGELTAQGLPTPPAGRIYEMWVQRGHAQPTPTGTLFSVTSGGAVTVGVPGSLHGVSAVLVSQEPAGGSPAPTSAPVIVARVS